MNTVKILHCSDMHIGASQSFLGVKSESRRYEVLSVFEKIIDICMQEQVQLLAIAGDMFDSNNIDMYFVKSVLDRFSDAKQLNIVFAAGNHDPLNAQSPLSKAKLPENLHILKTGGDIITLPEIGVRVYGRSFETAFMDGEQVPPAALDDNYINLMIVHADLTTDLQSRYNPITREFIEQSKMDYIALGHIHKRSEISRIGNTFFSYSGCPEGQGFDESGEKGVYIGTIGKGICELEFRPTARRKHIIERIDISHTPNEQISGTVLDILQQKYGSDYSENLYKIELCGRVDSNTQISTEAITSRISERVYFAKTADLTVPEEDLDALSSEKSLKGLFVKNMLKKIESADGESAEKYRLALKLGLNAFNKEVKFDDN